MHAITSRKNPVVARFRLLANDRAARRKEGLFLGQGEKLLSEALSSGCLPDTVLYSGKAPELPPQVRCVAASKELLAWISPMKSAPELIFSVHIPGESSIPRGRVLLAEDMQDPGNVGTILRTAEAAGFGTVYLDPSCASPYSGKSVAASMGSIFRIRTETVSSISVMLPELHQSGIISIAGDLRGQDFFGHPPFGSGVCVVIGSEGNGISEDVRKEVTYRCRLPIYGGADSLNAAVSAGIFIYDILRDL